MTYQETFEKIRELVNMGDFSFNNKHYAVEVDIIGEGEGAFYIELKTDGTVAVEPYDYKDNDCRLIVTGPDFIGISDGSIDSVKLFTVGRLKIYGDIDKALEFSNICNRARKEAMEKMNEKGKSSSESKK